MAKKSGIVKATNNIAGLAGKGPYMAREIMAGSKCMSGSRRNIETKAGDRPGPSRSTIAASKDIAGESGKGAFKPSELFPGGRKMSGAHGVVPKNTKTNMDYNTGGYRISAGCRTFRSGLLGPAGGGHGAGHASQPRGHKDKA